MAARRVWPMLERPTAPEGGAAGGSLAPVLPVVRRAVRLRRGPAVVGRPLSVRRAPTVTDCAPARARLRLACNARRFSNRRGSPACSAPRMAVPWLGVATAARWWRVTSLRSPAGRSMLALIAAAFAYRPRVGHRLCCRPAPIAYAAPGPLPMPGAAVDPRTMGAACDHARELAALVAPAPGAGCAARRAGWPAVVLRGAERLGALHALAAARPRCSRSRSAGRSRSPRRCCSLLALPLGRAHDARSAR